MILVLSPSPSLDATLEVPALEHGGIARPHRVTRVAGGKGLNAARVARALGARVQVATALGGPSGEWVESLLRADGVRFDAVRLDAPTRMCTAIVEDAGGAASTDLYEPATPFGADSWEAYLRLVAELATHLRPQWVALSGSMPAGVPENGIAELLTAAALSGARIVVDGSGAGLRASVAHADVVKINRGEAEELLGTALADASAACAGIRERFGIDAVVTDGIRGAAALLGEESSLLAAPSRQGRFPAGSGDAFLGGLLAGLDAEAGTDGALALAADAALRNALVPGQGVLAA